MMKAKFNWFLLVLLFSLNLASPIHAQSTVAPGLDQALKRATDAGLTEDHINRVLGAAYRFKLTENIVITWLDQLARVSGEHLPVEPFLTKMEEGMAKNIDPKTIRDVLDLLHRRFQEAGRFVKNYTDSRPQRPDKVDTPHAVIRIGNLFAAGLPIGELQRMHDDFPESELDSLIEAATFSIILKQSGIQPSLGETVIHTGLENHRFQTFPLDLAQTIKSARRRNIPPDTIGRMSQAVLGGTLTLDEAREKMGFDHPAPGRVGLESNAPSSNHGGNAGGSSGGPSGHGGGAGGGANGGNNGSGGSGNGGGHR